MSSQSPEEPEGHPPGDSRADPFRVGHLRADLGRRSVRGVGVNLISQVYRLGLRLVETIVLARLLAPEAFGLVAMVTSFIAILELFKDVGLSQATVHSEDISEAQATTLFWINVALSILLGGSLALASPLVAQIYGEPRVVDIVLVLSAVMVIGGFGIQHMAILRRQMRFGTLVIIETVSISLGVATSIAAAWLGAGYWALVILRVVHIVASVGLAVFACRWIPGPPQWAPGVKDLVVYGANLTGARVFIALRSFDQLILGYVWGARPLGLYTQATQVITQPSNRISGPVSSVMVPTLSRLQDAPEQFRRFYLIGVNGICLFTFPILAFAAADAELILGYLLAPKWLPAVPILRALVGLAWASTLGVAARWLFLPLGRTDLQLRTSVVLSALVLSGQLIGVQYGAVGIAIGVAAGQVIGRIPEMVVALRCSPVSGWSVIRILTLSTTISAAAGAAVLLPARLLPAMPPPLQLTLDAAVFGAVYFLLIFVFPQTRRDAGQLLRMARARLRPRPPDDGV